MLSLTAEREESNVLITLRRDGFAIEPELSNQFHRLFGRGFEVVRVSTVEFSVGGHDDGLPDVFETDFSDTSELFQLAVGVGDDGEVDFVFLGVFCHGVGIVARVHGDEYDRFTSVVERQRIQFLPVGSTLRAAFFEEP